MPDPRTHGVPECALDHIKDGLTPRSFILSRPLDSQAVQVIDGSEFTMLD